MEYIPNTSSDRGEMLKYIGVSSIEELLTSIPEEIRLKRHLNIPSGLSELELVRAMRELASINGTIDEYISFLGGGAYDHFIPAVISHIISRSEFYTAYTPYQAEMSQGLLQSIYEFQTMICELTGMEVANASMYDGATAMAEAVLMALRINKKREEILVSSAIHPFYRDVLRTYMRGLKHPLISLPWKEGLTDVEFLKKRLSEKTCAVIVQYPNFFGVIEDIVAIGEYVKNSGATFIVVADPVGLAILTPPGIAGADIVVGECQSLGIPLNFGGPYAGFFATKMEYVRKMPGRLVGATVDVEGRRGYCLTFQTREQHIKRERATSNICTNEALVALAATVYMALTGKDGLREVAFQCLQKATYAREQIEDIDGYEVPFKAPIFKEFVVKASIPVEHIRQTLLEHKILGGIDMERYYPELKNHMLVCVTEKRTKGEIDKLVEVLRK